MNNRWVILREIHLNYQRGCRLIINIFRAPIYLFPILIYPIHCFGSRRVKIPAHFPADQTGTIQEFYKLSWESLYGGSWKKSFDNKEQKENRGGVVGTHCCQARARDWAMLFHSFLRVFNLFFIILGKISAILRKYGGSAPIGLRFLERIFVPEKCPDLAA